MRDTSISSRNTNLANTHHSSSIYTWLLLLPLNLQVVIINWHFTMEILTLLCLNRPQMIYTITSQFVIYTIQEFRDALMMIQISLFTCSLNLDCQLATLFLFQMEWTSTFRYKIHETLILMDFNTSAQQLI